MTLDKHYDAGKVEPQLREFWSEIDVYRFDLKPERL